MKLLTATVFALGLTTGMFAQTTAGQDMKNAGTDTKEAAKSAGKSVVKGTKKVGHTVKKGTHKVANKAAEKTQ